MKEVKNKKTNYLKLLIILFIVTILVIGLGIFITLKNANAKTFMEKSITSINKLVSNNIQDTTDIDINKDYFIYNGNIKLETTSKYFNNISIDYKSTLSLKDEYLSYNINLEPVIFQGSGIAQHGLQPVRKLWI